MSIWSEISRYLKLHRQGWESWNQSQQAESTRNVVISLTTLPSRIRKITPTLNSLLDQTELPHKIIINIPEYSEREKKEYDVPAYLLNSPRIMIQRVKHDLGPATKLLPTLEYLKDRPETPIIVVDDDEIYPANLVENYLLHLKNTTSPCALTLCGWIVPDSNLHQNKKPLRGGDVRLFKHDRQRLSAPAQVDCVQGASSYCVTTRCFSEKVFDYTDAPRAAYFVDDIWISGHLARNKTQVFVIPIVSRYIRLQNLYFRNNSDTLKKTDNRDGRNNQAIYEYFANDWLSKKGSV